MIKLWAKLYKKGRIQESFTATDDHEAYSLRDRVDLCMEQVIHALDLARPLWLPVNHQEMETFGITRFTQDHFIEHFPYDSLEIEIIGTDEDEEEEEA